MTMNEKKTPLDTFAEFVKFHDDLPFAPTDPRELIRHAVSCAHRMQYWMTRNPLHAAVADSIDAGRLEVEVRDHKFVVVPVSERN